MSLSKCSHCGEPYAFGFQGELIGGCKEVREWQAVEQAKKLLNQNEKAHQINPVSPLNHEKP